MFQKSCKHAYGREVGALMACSSKSPLGWFLEYTACEQVMKFEFPQDTEKVKNSCFYLHIRISINTCHTEMQFTAFLTAVKTVTNTEKIHR